MTDETPPSIECPGAQVQRLSVSQTGYRQFDPASFPVAYNASDAVLTFSSSVPLNFSYADVGTVSIVTATAIDASGNNASCQFEVVIEGMSCDFFICRDKRVGVGGHPKLYQTTTATEDLFPHPLFLTRAKSKGHFVLFGEISKEKCIDGSNDTNDTLNVCAAPVMVCSALMILVVVVDGWFFCFWFFLGGGWYLEV